MNKHAVNYLLLLLIPILISMSWLLGADLIHKISPLTLSSFRLLIGALVLLIFADFKNLFFYKDNKKLISWWLNQLILSIFGRMFYFYLSAKSLLLISPFEAILVSSSLPVIILLIQRALGKLFISPLMPVFSFASFMAVILSMYFYNNNFNNFNLGHLEIFVAMIAFAIHLILYPKLIGEHEKPVNVLFAQFILGAMFLLPMNFQDISSFFHLSIAEWIKFLVYSVVCNLLPFVIVHYALRRTSAFVVGMTSILSPLFTIISKDIFYKQALNNTFIILSLISCLFISLTIAIDFGILFNPQLNLQRRNNEKI